jgi:hypoxanthine phosphoribosyltransferase
MEKMKKKFYSWNDVHDTATSIAMQMYKDNWRPDYIVGLNRGGLPLSVILSHLTDCNHYALDVRLRDGDGQGPESNCWMAEDAFGYEHYKILEHNADISASAGEPILNLPISRENILIVDDINDTGATFNWIKQDWQSSCLPDDPNWNTVWGQNVRFAVMTENLSSGFGEVQYHWDEVNKVEEDVWLVYPYEKQGR